MNQILVMIAAVASFSVMADEVIITDLVLKEALGKQLKKPYGKFAPPMKLTEAEAWKVTSLDLDFTQITDTGLKDVAKLQNLDRLHLLDTKITDEGLGRWPSCRISNGFYWGKPKSPMRASRTWQSCKIL